MKLRDILEGAPLVMPTSKSRVGDAGANSDKNSPMEKSPMKPDSRLPGFYRLSPWERLRRVLERFPVLGKGASAEEVYQGKAGLSLNTADQMVENVIGLFALPVGVAVNLRMNGQDRVIPMVVEEPSVVAAVSHMAKISRGGAGLETSSTRSMMIGQVQVLDVPDMPKAIAALEAAHDELLAAARTRAHRLCQRGGGPESLSFRQVQVPEEDGGGTFLIVHILVDCLDAMGANLVNDLAEHLAPRIGELTKGRIGLRILSNYCDQRLATARLKVPAAKFKREGATGAQVAQAIVDAYRFASADPYRAATHNKGIMNGIDAVALATGNDWRAIESGAHAYASRTGTYRPMSRFWIDDDGDLMGELTLPLAVGTVGGTSRSHPTAQANLEMMNISGARDLAEVMVSVGLVQNLAALHALATDGIQRGHMSLHARHIAGKAGVPHEHVETVVGLMVEQKRYGEDDARAIWSTMRTEA